LALSPGCGWAFGVVGFAAQAEKDIRRTARASFMGGLY
jgi:hypothetical protein